MTEKASCAPLREYKEQILTPVQQEDTPREAVKLREGWHSVDMVFGLKQSTTHKHDNAPSDSTTPLHVALSVPLHQRV